MRFAFGSLLASVLALGPVVAHAEEASTAMRVSDVAAEVLKKGSTCDDKSHGCPHCGQEGCEGCAKGSCEAYIEHMKPDWSAKYPEWSL